MNKILNNVKNHIVYYLFMTILVVLGAYLIYTNYSYSRQIEENNKVIDHLMLHTTLTKDLIEEHADSTGRYLTLASEKNKDAVITTKLKAYQMDGKWFFTGHQDLKINSSLYLYTNQMNLYGLEIQNIEEIN